MLKPDSYHCSQCDYELTGMPEIGKCPECGNPYSTRSMLGVKIPSSGFDKGERLFRRLRTYAFGVLALMVLTCSGLLSLIVPRPDRAWAIGGLLAVVLILMAVTSYLYEKE